MNGFIKKGVAAVMAGTMMLSGCTADQGRGSETLSLSEINKGNTRIDISCHDPQVIYDGEKYVMTGSHQIIATSDDLESWEYVAKGNNMFTNIYDGDLPAFAFTGKNEEGGYSVWASNIFYNDVMKKYIMYFCTTSSYIRSSLCMATADKAEGPYIFESAFLHSGFGKSDVKDTNLYDVLGKDADVSDYLEYGGYNNKKWPNCIDPAVFVDENDRQWLVYGSWSGGIFLLELDPSTGLPIHPKKDSENGVDPYFGRHLIGGGHHACEGPFIDYNEDTGYYYLFVSYGELKREGGYQIRQFRSKDPEGPYLDYAGKTLGDEDDYFSYGIKMAGNYSFPSLETGYMAPGGQSSFEGGDGNMYISYHQRFDDGSEYFEPRIHRLFMNEDGWYVMAPFETGTENIQDGGYDDGDLAGRWYLLDHGMEVGSKIREAVECDFKDGSITGLDDEVTYELSEGTNNIRLKVKDAVYSGVIIDMEDEAKNKVRCIMASGSDDHTIWAVQYLK